MPFNKPPADPFSVPHSSVEDIAWPAIVNPSAAARLALLHQLDATQWWPEAVLRREQFRQLGKLVAHAWRTVPYYRGPLAAAGYAENQDITPEFLSRLPVLSRRDIQGSFDALASTAVPRQHGKLNELRTSGSTGTPVKIIKTHLDLMFWRAFYLREHLWHRRDQRLKLAVIRAGHAKTASYPAGEERDHWPGTIGEIYPTGPSAVLSLSTALADQAEWLIRQDPAYLMSVPSNLRALARHFRDRNLALPALREVRTVGEVVDPELREDCRAAWGVAVTDMYSATEVGYIALQCPDHPHYHVQSESMLVEVLDEDGRPCAAGAQGRVVVTPLHNFAMPLLRYAIGDMAVVGAPCPCGRGLPVITRVLGRVRDMLVLPSGDRRYPTGWYRQCAQIEGVVQFQLVQKAVSDLELRLVVRPPFRPASDEPRLRGILHRALGEHFTLAFTYHDEIQRARGGKFFDFVCELGNA